MTKKTFPPVIVTGPPAARPEPLYAGIKPDALRDTMIRKARASWCFCTEYGGSFFVREDHARSMLARNPLGKIYPPEAQS